MANTFVHGRLGTVSLAGPSTAGPTLFAVLQFSFKWITSLSDITFTVSGGATAKRILPGYYWATGTLTFVYDTTNQPVLSPQQMTPNTLMALILYPEGTKPYSFNAYSGEFDFTSGPQGNTPVSCTTNFESDGAITPPSS